MFAGLVLFAVALVGSGLLSWVVGDGADVTAAGAETVAPANGTTVITTSMQGNNRIVAYAPDGSVLYFNDSHGVYDDVDPSPRGAYTVTYIGTEKLNRAECHSSEPCTRQFIERVNLTTGEAERLYSRVVAKAQNHWHDADRIGPHRWLVADIAHDRVFVVNTSTGIETWSWHAQNGYDVRSGGIFPNDWTHLNDVERLPDGRVMVSLRNQDTVAFVDPETGVRRGWSLGSDGNHSRLYEQHNPDYIPPERGGPSVVVADSENNRIVEYQRVNRTDTGGPGGPTNASAGTWTRTWQWRDTELRWPRDADRLPNGHTLITDTNGGRVIEVDEAGRVVWRVDIEGPYEAERLGTGDESAGGPSAVRAGIESRSVAEPVAESDRPVWEAAADEAVAAWSSVLPSIVVNPLLYVLPPWIGIVELGGLLSLPPVALAWGLAELYWSPYGVRLSRSDGVR